MAFGRASRRKVEEQVTALENEKLEQENAKQRGPAILYDAVVFGGLDKTDKVKFNAIARDIGQGDWAIGYRKISEWHRAKCTFSSIEDRYQKVFTDYAGAW